MIPIAHTHVKDLAAIAQGDFCFITNNTISGLPIRWAYSIKLKDYSAACRFLTYYARTRE